jgi:hypothetical protein
MSSQRFFNVRQKRKSKSEFKILLALKKEEGATNQGMKVLAIRQKKQADGSAFSPPKLPGGMEHAATLIQFSETHFGLLISRIVEK